MAAAQSDQLQVMLHMLNTELARRRTLEFCAFTKSDWVTAPHHEYLCDLADRVISGEIRRLLISLPPRHTKSEIFSIRLPAMYLGKYPHRQIIHASYAAALSNDFSRQVRALLRSDRRYAQTFKVRLDPERQRVDDWKTAEGGGFYSVGVGGGVTGHGADLFIIDDPTKEGDELSPTALDAIVTWFLSAARTRLSPQGQIVIPMTRWHPNDLIGVLIRLMQEDEYADQWEVVSMPGLIETQQQAGDDPLGRQVGEALWPERFSVRDLLAVKALSPRYFQALYQQNPQPDVVKLFDKDDFIRMPRSEILDRTEGLEYVWCVDLAASEKDVADYTVMARVCYDGAVLWISDVFRAQLPWPRIKRLLTLTLIVFKRDLMAFPKHFLELLAVKELQRTKFSSRLRQVDFPPGTDKRARALVFSERTAARRVVVVEGKRGDAFVAEHDRFPDKNDDCVDVSSVATHHFGLMGEIQVIIKQAEERQSPVLQRLLQQERAYVTSPHMAGR